MKTINAMTKQGLFKALLGTAACVAAIAAQLILRGAWETKSYLTAAIAVAILLTLLGYIWIAVAQAHISFAGDPEGIVVRFFGKQHERIPWDRLSLSVARDGRGRRVILLSGGETKTAIFYEKAKLRAFMVGLMAYDADMEIKSEIFSVQERECMATEAEGLRAVWKDALYVD